MNLSIDQIAFGNPSSRDREIMQVETYLDRIIPGLQQYTPPKNSSARTKEELKYLVDLIATPRDQTNNMYDEAVLPYITEIFIKAGAHEELIKEVMKSIQEDVIPIITKLKYYFQRPRPAQLSFYYNIPLYSDFSYFTNNPSYPSGHTTLTTITCEVLGNLYPEAYQRMKNLTDEVEKSRLFLGVHYPSDNDMARVVAKRVLENAEFKIKYRL